MLTSVNLSNKSANFWRNHQNKLRMHILRHCERLSHLKPIRDRATTYNLKGRSYEKISIRFSPVEYNLLRYYSHALRISVSRILDALIRSLFSKILQTYPDQKKGHFTFISAAKPGHFFKVTEAWYLEPDIPEKLAA